MYLQIKKIVLWSREQDQAPRVLEFKTGQLNVISGASKTGKSAIIPIVDYCLGADKCRIPVGIIRENCSWFGVLIETLEGDKLLARREPGEQQSTSDMFLLEGPSIAVPDTISEKNANVDSIKAKLDRLSGLVNIGAEPDTEAVGKARPSFRDLMAFTFQPQNIVANPDVMFFKADTTEHREKLKGIFPYVLGAVPASVLHARFELDRLGKVLRRKETEHRAVSAASTAWQREAQGWLRQAVELGLLPQATLVPEGWPDILAMLKDLSARTSGRGAPSLAGIDSVLDRLVSLRDAEAAAAAKVNDHRQRLNELRRLAESSQMYVSGLRIQRDRLDIARWLRRQESTANDPLSAIADRGDGKLDRLYKALDALDVQLGSHPALSENLARETLRQRASTESALEELNVVRREILSLEQTSKEAQEAANRFDRTERFLGRLQQALLLYETADGSAELAQEIADLKARMATLQAVVAEGDIRRRLSNALERVQAKAGAIIPRLDAEWPDAPIRLLIEDLTIKVLRGPRDDYIWEIGSGANWLAYHVALTLALQKFFLEDTNSVVPALLIYDQPSQVYFPRRAADEKSNSNDEKGTGSLELKEPVLDDEDIEAVRKVFALLSHEVGEARGRLQVIVLDHADEGVWGGLANLYLVEEWRGSALVPAEWL